MGDFAQPADLQIAVGGEGPFTELADLEGTGDTDPAANQAIARGEARALGFLRRRVSIEALKAAKPQIVVDLVLDLSRYYLASAKGLGDLEVYYRNYKDAIAILADFAAGRIDLDLEDKPTGSFPVTVGGIVTPVSQEDGGPYWDDDWREEGTTDDDVNDGLP